MPMTLLQRIRYIWVRAGIVVLIASPIAMYLVFRAQGLPDDTFASTAAVRVNETDEYIEFARGPSGDVGWAQPWILVPGCPADPRAYAPLGRALASRGFYGSIVKVPYRCAPWPQHSAELRRRVTALMANCFHCRWTLIGHSRGVPHVLEMVRMLPRGPSGAVESLVLMGSTHPRADDYSDLPMRVMKIMASNDGVAPLDAALASRALLPPSTRWEVIEGGNHSQFAYYGFQLFDGRAAISREEQHRRVVDLIVSALLGWSPNLVPAR